MLDLQTTHCSSPWTTTVFKGDWHLGHRWMYELAGWRVLSISVMAWNHILWRQIHQTQCGWMFTSSFHTATDTGLTPCLKTDPVYDYIRCATACTATSWANLWTPRISIKDRCFLAVSCNVDVINTALIKRYSNSTKVFSLWHRLHRLLLSSYAFGLVAVRDELENVFCCLSKGMGNWDDIIGLSGSLYWALLTSAHHTTWYVLYPLTPQPLHTTRWRTSWVVVLATLMRC